VVSAGSTSTIRQGHHTATQTHLQVMTTRLDSSSVQLTGRMDLGFEAGAEASRQSDVLNSAANTITHSLLHEQNARLVNQSKFEVNTIKFVVNDMSMSLGFRV
jgi:hypothetical protein